MDYRLPGSSVHGVFRREYWSGWPFPSLGDLPDSWLNLLLLRLLHLPLSHHMLTYKIEFKYLSLVPWTLVYVFLAILKVWWNQAGNRNERSQRSEVTGDNWPSTEKGGQEHDPLKSVYVTRKESRFQLRLDIVKCRLPLTEVVLSQENLEAWIFISIILIFKEWRLMHI